DPMTGQPLLHDPKTGGIVYVDPQTKKYVIVDPRTGLTPIDASTLKTGQAAGESAPSSQIPAAAPVPQNGAATPNGSTREKK
ncbi:MAG: hypothetical protein ABI197_04505, partial [Granulicella sp.]